MIMSPKRGGDDSTTEDDSSSGHKPSSGRSKRVKLDKDSTEYKARRDRNNVAVKKSRERSRTKAKETMDQVDHLRTENAVLEQKVEILSKELSVLKDLFLSHAGSFAPENEVPNPPLTPTSPTKTDHEYSISSKPLKQESK
jgi:CCAAT/enhancer binding protein (C/EBP) gamma